MLELIAGDYAWRTGADLVPKKSKYFDSKKKKIGQSKLTFERKEQNAQSTLLFIALCK